jgi:hypothetical protein
VFRKLNALALFSVPLLLGAPYTGFLFRCSSNPIKRPVIRKIFQIILWLTAGAYGVVGVLLFCN